MTRMPVYPWRLWISGLRNVQYARFPLVFAKIPHLRPLWLSLGIERCVAPHICGVVAWEFESRTRELVFGAVESTATIFSYCTMHSATSVSTASMFAIISGHETTPSVARSVPFSYVAAAGGFLSQIRYRRVGWHSGSCRHRQSCSARIAVVPRCLLTAISLRSLNPGVLLRILSFCMRPLSAKKLAIPGLIVDIEFSHHAAIAIETAVTDR